MIEDLIRERLEDYRPANVLEQEHALAEIMQQLVLGSLAQAGFFAQAMFHGGTCLRILFGMRRFSEDLDFLLKKPDPQFRWQRYLERVRKRCEREGIDFEVQDRSELKSSVRKAFLKTDSVGKLALLRLAYSRRTEKKITIKLEIDVNPPAGSTYETRYLAFPTTSAITTQALTSGFGTKSHALLCRGYAKGRDWYDFLWYVSRKVKPDLELLGNALDQQGPWAGQGIRVTAKWYLQALRARVEEIDWRVARSDVIRFVPAAEQQSVELWDRAFFRYHLDRLAEYL